MPTPPPVTAVVLQPAPLDTLVIPAALDGGDGTNRATGGTAQLAAANDLDAIRAWLARFADTPATFDSYRKEAERLLLWSLAQLGKPLSSLTHEDCLRYQHFLADPQPAATWVANAGTGGGRKHPRGDARWRPFYGPLSPASVRQATVILNVLFSWLVQAGYLAGNPLALSRQRTRKVAPRITRYLEPGLWQEVKDFIASMPQDTPRARAHAHRVRWLFTLLYLGGLRIAEVGGNTMGQFFVRRDADGTMRWWLTVHGKGDRDRLVPATRELMAELTRYRQSLGMTPCPHRMRRRRPCCRSEKPQAAPREKLQAVRQEKLQAARRNETAGKLKADRPRRSRGPRCTPSSSMCSRPLPTGCAHAATRSRHAPTCSGKLRRTGCGIPPALTWRTSRWICGWCATISGTRR
jgi:integrase